MTFLIFTYNFLKQLILDGILNVFETSLEKKLEVSLGQKWFKSFITALFLEYSAFG